jgi:3-oxoacyl-[acyl-carrier-protein] synthase II
VTPLQNEPVAITGIGCVTPLGSGAETLYRGWLAGRCAIEAGFGRCAGFDPGAVLTARECRRNDRYVQMTLVACEEAASQAGWIEGVPYEPDRLGSVVATAFAGQHTFETELDKMRAKGALAVAPLRVLMAAPNAAAVAIAMRYGLRGESFGLSGACAGGAQAVGAGMRLIRAGALDGVVVAGADAEFTGLGQATYAALGAVSPTGRCLPFDRRRDGMVPGEGAGVLVIENADKARARGATLLGELVGYGSGNDAYHLTMPNPASQARTIETALADGGVAPEDLAYVNAHGTGTRLNDVSETEALKRALGGHAHRVPVSSLKSSIGHLQGGAGAVEAIATLLALRDGTAPPTLSLEEPDDGLDLDYVPGVRRALDPAHIHGGRARGLTNSFGLGGHNASLVLRASVGARSEASVDPVQAPAPATALT